MSNAVKGLVVCEVHNDLFIKCKTLHEKVLA